MDSTKVNDSFETELIQENEKTLKMISPFSFVVDINNLKLPLFLYSNFKQEIDSDGKKKEFEEYEESWYDSKNISRKFYMYNKGRLPRQFEQDVFYGLLGLFVQKNAPFTYNESKHKYEINVSKVEFSWYELCRFIKVECTGYYINKMKDAIRMLKSTQYFSYEEGVFYDREFKRYKKSGETGMSLLQDYAFKKTSTSNNSDEYADENMVNFADIIINNLRYEYFKFLNLKLYFEIIPSGIERGLYGYLEANRYDGEGKELPYVKRKYETLCRDIPIEFTYASELTRRLKKPLDHLKQIGYLKDYGFGHILKINGEKENSLYFCFGMSMKDLERNIKKKAFQQLKLPMMEEVVEDLEEDNESKYENYLELPKNDLLTELITKGIDEKTSMKIVAEHDKWHIIKYLIWVNKKIVLKQINEKDNSIAGLLRIAIEQPYPINSCDQDIIDFVDNESKKEKEIEIEINDTLELEYQKYINENIEEFIKNENNLYQMFYNDTLTNLKDNYKNRYKMIKQTNGSTVEIEEFKEKGADSKFFKDNLLLSIRLYKKLMNIEEFKYNSMKKNNE